jgi:hypothetical protein
MLLESMLLLASLPLMIFLLLLSRETFVGILEKDIILLTLHRQEDGGLTRWQLHLYPRGTYDEYNRRSKGVIFLQLVDGPPYKEIEAMFKISMLGPRHGPNIYKNTKP